MMQLQNQLKAYIAYQKWWGSRREITITRYSEYLKKRYNYLVQKYNSLDIDMNVLEMSDISDFALTLTNWRKRKTVNGYLAGIKNFLKRSYKHHDYTKLKFDQIEFMKQESYTADILTDTELQELFSMPAIHEQQEILAIRNELFIKMLYCTGMRVSEITHLEVAVMDEQQFSIIGKGGYKRSVFITPEIYELFDTYTFLKDKPSKYVFVGHTKHGTVKQPDKALTKECLEKIIKGYRELMWTHKKITPHTLRHTFASNLAMKWADIYQIQKLLGHKSIKTTEIYLHVHDKHLIHAHSFILDTMR